MANWKVLTETTVIKLVEALTPFFLGKAQDSLIRFADEVADAAYNRAYDDIEIVLDFRTDLMSNAGASMIGSSTGQSVEARLNGFEPAYGAGTTSQYLRGDKTWVDFSTSVRGAPLTGYTVGANSALTATDTVLTGFGKLQGQVNAREAAITAGTTAQYWRGDKSWQTLNTAAVPESGSLYFTNARAIGAALTGYTVGSNTALAAADTILAAFGKVQAQLNNKQASGSYESAITSGTTAQYWRGDKTWQDFGSSVRAAALTGFSVGFNTSVTATDSVLSAFQNVQAQLNNKQAAGSYVTSVSVATSGGVSGSSSGGTTPSLTIALGAITPTSVAASGAISAGGTVSGNDFTTSRGDGTGVIFLGTAFRYLYYNGSYYHFPGAAVVGDGGFQQGSSRKLKDIDGNIPYGLAEVERLNPVIGKYKADYVDDGKQRLFMIAEEVAEVIPEAVSPELIKYNGEKVAGLDASQLIPVLVQAVKELSAQVKGLKEQIDGNRLS